jgi:hypothetical protein
MKFQTVFIVEALTGSKLLMTARAFFDIATRNMKLASKTRQSWHGWFAAFQSSVSLPYLMRWNSSPLMKQVV